MKDIRPDLRERLERLHQERAIVEMQLEELTAREASLQLLLQEEDERMSVPAEQMHLAEQRNSRSSSPLAQFLLKAFSRQPECTLRELKDAALKQGIRFGDKNAGRAIHFALVGMARHGLVQRQRDGKWRVLE
jgi:hypothetical protein